MKEKAFPELQNRYSTTELRWPKTDAGNMRREAATVKFEDVKRITQHDMRHLFATRCIEQGVDIPTVSRWLDQQDGRALCMKTYGHLRDEHSQVQALKVTF